MIKPLFLVGIQMVVSLNWTRMGFGFTDLDRVSHQQGERGGHERADRGGLVVSGSWHLGRGGVEELLKMC